MTATIILAALMGAFVLAFAVRVAKGLIQLVYALAPYVMLVVGVIALLVYLERYEPQEKASPATQHEVKQ